MNLHIFFQMAMSSIGSTGAEVDYMQRDGFEGSGSGNGPDDDNDDEYNPTGSGSGTGAIPEGKRHNFCLRTNTNSCVLQKSPEILTTCTHPQVPRTQTPPPRTSNQRPPLPETRRLFSPLYSCPLLSSYSQDYIRDFNEND